MKYFTIISRDEFIKLINFGRIYLTSGYIIDEKSKDDNLKKLFTHLPCDDDICFLVISFKYTIEHDFFTTRTLIELNIKDIFNIYCLTERSLDFYKSKFNPKIQFKLYPNTTINEDFKLYKTIQDKLYGIRALFEIFKFDISRCQEECSKKYIEEILEYKENDYLKQEFKSFYFDLFCYERKNSFLKEDIGFLCDLRAISFLKKREDIASFLSGNLNFRKDDDETNRDKNIYDLVKENIEKINDDERKRHFIIGAIFLKSQKLLNTDKRDVGYWGAFIELINKFKEDFFEETQIAICRLGIFLGYKYLYDDYYEQLELNIYKELNYTDEVSNTAQDCPQRFDSIDSQELKAPEIDEKQDNIIAVSQKDNSQDELVKLLYGIIKFAFKEASKPTKDKIKTEIKQFPVLLAQDEIKELIDTPNNPATKNTKKTTKSTKDDKGQNLLEADQT